MTDDTTVLLKLYELQWAFARQAEEQRTQITNIILLIASAITGFIAQRGLNVEMLPLTLLLTAIGAYGVIISEKLYERFNFFRTRINSVEMKLDALHPGAQIMKLWLEADEHNSKDYPKLHRLRLHRLWLVLHLGIALAGLSLTLLVIFAPRM